MNPLDQRFLSKTKREFLSPEQISRHLRCSICQEVFEDPVRTACGHTFCYICIENWAAINKVCPLCKRSIRKRRLQKDLIALNIIDDLPARCMHANCTWQGLYSLVKKHQRWCQFKPRRQQEEELVEAVQLEIQISDAGSNEVIEILSPEETLNNDNTPNSLESSKF